MKKILLPAFLLFSFMVSNAQPSALYNPEVFISENDTLPYRILFPENFDVDGNYPLILFLHGAGERGNDNEKQLVHGSGFFANDENRTSFPAVVVFPQCAENSYWAGVGFGMNDEGKRTFSFNPSGEPTPPMKLTIGLLESLLQEDWVDKQRVYVGGLSMGGMGTFELLFRMPEVFAAAFPICGGGNPEMISEKVSDVSIWAFHGEEDPVVPSELSVEMLTAYLKAGVSVKLTLYSGVGHNAWDYAFQEPGLLPWLFSNHK